MDSRFSALISSLLLIVLISISGIVIWYQYNERLNLSRDHFKSERQLQLSSTTEFIKDYLAYINKSLSGFGSAKYNTKLYAEYIKGSVSLREEIEALFSNYSHSVPTAFQVRWIDGQGHELVRIDKSRSGISKSIETDQLQDKSKSKYHSEIINLNSGTTYMSNFNLNMEHGVVETPIRPTFRMAYRLPHTNDEKNEQRIDMGYIIVNYEGDNLLERLYAKLDGLFGELIISNNKKHLIHNQDENINWGFMFGNKSNLETLLPGLAGKMVSNKKPGITEYKDGIWTWSWITSESLNSAHFFMNEDWLIIIGDTKQAYALIKKRIKEEAFTVFSITCIIVILAIAALYKFLSIRHTHKLAIQTEKDKREKHELISSERKRLEEYWKNIVNNIPHNVWLSDEKGDFTFVNSNWIAFHGDIVIGETNSTQFWLSCVHNDDLQIFQKAWHDTKRVSEETTIIVRLADKNKQFRWFQFRITSLVIDHYDGIWFGVNTDIDDLVKKNIEVNEVNEVNKNIIEYNPVGCIEVDIASIINEIDSISIKPDTSIDEYLDKNIDIVNKVISNTKIVTINSSAKALFFNNEKVSFVETLEDVIPNIKDNIVYFASLIIDVIRSKRITYKEAKLSFHNDRCKYVRVSISASNPFNLTGSYLLTIQDETDSVEMRSKLEKHKEILKEEVANKTNELNEARRFLESLTHSLPMPVIYLNSDRDIVFSNSTFNYWFSLEAGDKYSNIANAIPSELLSEITPVMNDVFLAQPRSLQCDLTTTAGETKNTLIVMIPDLDNLHKVKGITLIINDITSIRVEQNRIVKLNQELEVRTKQAEKANKSKTDFVANMSHEIRTPMNGILGLLTVMEDTPLNSEQQVMLAKIHKSSKSLLNILNEILDYSKLEACQVILHESDFKISNLLEDISDLFSISAAEKNINLVVQLDVDVPSYLVGDSLRLGQVLNNLVGNAIKFTSEGYVKLRVELLKYIGDEVTLQFTVEDTGIGIERSKTSHIFSIFTQADESSTRNFGGTGLGLAICKSIVELMGGEIGVNSVAGQGSTFWFRVTFKQAAITATPLNISTTIDRILIVDSHEEQASVLNYYLSSWGSKVVSASSVNEMKSIIEEHNHSHGLPRAIIVDDRLISTESNSCAFIEILTSTCQSYSPSIFYLVGPTFSFEKMNNNLPKGSIIHRPITSSKVFNAFKACQTNVEEVTRDTLSSITKRSQRIHGKVALVVEDNDVNQDVATALLNKLGMKAEVASDGAEGVSKFNREKHDIVLMDLQMPKMDGFTATQRIRQLPGGMDIPILAMTAAAFDQDREKVLASGMNAHIPKPLDIEVLLKTLLIYLAPVDSGENFTPTQTTIPEIKQNQSDLLLREILLKHEEGFDFDDALRKLSDDPSILIKVSQTFVARAPKWESAFHSHHKNGNKEALASLAHTIKGAAASIGSSSLHKACIVLEKTMKSDSTDSHEELLMKWYDIFTHTLSVVKDRLNAISNIKENTVTRLTDDKSKRISINNLTSLLEAIEVSLIKNDLVSENLIHELNNIYTTSDIAEDIEILDRAISDFSYEMALECINSLREKIKLWQKSA